ncbi:MAG: hypothetical protein HPZ89_08370 [Oscillospiraceae bacterium]|nr:hypothetical protein [Oscillospiraceae bacterium]
MPNERDDSILQTPRKGLMGWLRGVFDRTFGRPALTVRLKGEPDTLYPGMSRKEIRHVAAAICRAARRNAK